MSTKNNAQFEMTTLHKKALNKKSVAVADNLMRELTDMHDDATKDGQMLSIDDVFELMNLYFNRKYVMYAHAKNSFDKFIEDDIKNFLSKSDNTFFEKITKDKNIKYKFEFENIAIRPPVGSDGQYLFPSEAREKNLTYSSKLVAKVTQIQEISDIFTKEIVSRKVIGDPEDNVPIATIPILVRSKFCSLNLKKDFDETECEYDPGCYFIVNGAEKVVISQERMCENKPLVFVKKDSNSHMHVVQVNSRSPTINGLMQVMTINLKNNGMLTLRVPILTEFPVLILFRALGIESDKEIIDYIVHDKNDADMLDLVIRTIRMSTDEKGTAIKTQHDAINYLANKIRVLRKYSETDKDIRQKQKRLHLEHLLDNNFLPHITGGRVVKAYYIGYMINRLLNCALGRVLPDDRDSYLNKRVDLVGNLMDELFRQFFRKMLNECNKYFKKRNTNDEEPINIINQIRPNTIEQGLKAALLTGAWGKKKGVAQVLQRLTYLQAIEFFRRIDSPSNDAASSKLTSPRHLHATQNANLCCVVGDTEILLSDGITKKKIKDFTLSDTILTVNPETLEEEISTIHNFFKKEPEKVLKLTTMTGKTIKCTADHPLLVHTTMGNVWRRADELKIDDKLIIRNSHAQQKNTMLDQLVTTEVVENEPVYDFTTSSNNHSFIANDIIVHNCVETPEHAKVGLVKHLTIIGSVTVPTLSQLHIIKNILVGKLIQLNDIHPSQLIKYTKVFLNGDWIGVCENALPLFKEFKQMKYTGTIESTTSIVYDDETNELKIYCDGGRLFRPVIRVENNKLLLTKKHIEMISPNKTKSETMITSWDEFMQRNPGVMEYIDSDEQAYSMISPSIETLHNMKLKEISSQQKAMKSKEVDKTNRYGDMMFISYSHCEIHPSLLLGLIATNIPFLNHNQGPRNIFQYAQGRQAMCIYISNYRYRLDTSYILYHPHKPLVNTRTSKFMYNDILSPGENAVVAIGCYTGWNQEDSIVFNKSAIDRGLFRSTSYNKYVSIIQKNQSTSQDDIFMKPDPTKVAGMKHGSYDKLNEKGYIPEETVVGNGDFLIGKVSPIQPTANSNKLFKDNSESYKQHVPGVVDKVFSDIYNVEGYEMKKMRVRSERIPAIGDKFCCYTPDHDILTSIGWIPISSVTLNHKVACLVDGKTLEYLNPTDIQTYDYNGNMYVVDSNQVKLKVTPNHRMYVGNRNKTNYQIMTSESIYHKRKCYLKNVDNYSCKYDVLPNELKITNGIVTHFVLPKLDDCAEMALPINDWLMFIGIWYAGANTNANHQKITMALEQCCKNMKFDNDQPWESNVNRLMSYISQYSESNTSKTLPNWVWFLNREQCNVIIDGMLLKDEHDTKNGLQHFDTLLKQLADDIQRLCLHAGCSANINLKSKEIPDTYRITIVTAQNKPLVNKNIKTNGENNSDRYEPYIGKVHCCTVPNDGVIYVRKDGCPVWCGNSRHG